jgi:hypothetical protein
MSSSVKGTPGKYRQAKDSPEFAWREEAFGAEAPEWAKDSMNYDATARCGACGAWETVVRPGKTQCDICESIVFIPKIGTPVWARYNMGMFWREAIVDEKTATRFGVTRDGQYGLTVYVRGLLRKSHRILRNNADLRPRDPALNGADRPDLLAAQAGKDEVKG